MKVKLKDITLGEIQQLCKKHDDSCLDCPFRWFCLEHIDTNGDGTYPSDWNLEKEVLL